MPKIIMGYPNTLLGLIMGTPKYLAAIQSLQDKNHLIRSFSKNYGVPIIFGCFPIIARLKTLPYKIKK
jgi:hypothetical protein